MTLDERAVDGSTARDGDNPAPPGPLAGIRVLDFTRVLSGPLATMLLADLGADVVKIEDPNGGDTTRTNPPHFGGESHYFLALNRSKKSIAIDLKSRQARSLVRSLTRHFDVVVENYRPEVMQRLGLDYASLSKAHPGLVYCSVSAFGQRGPYAARPGFDLVAQALSGAMALTGEPGGTPLRMGLSMGDLVAGLLAVVGVTATLTERARTGKGGFVDVSMLDGLLGLLTYHASRWLLCGEDAAPVGSGHPSYVPYGAYPAQDGYLVIAPFTEGFWPKVCAALDHPEWTSNPDYATNQDRLRRRQEVDDMVTGVLLQNTVSEWCRRLEQADVPHAPILSVGEALSQEHVAARGLLTTVQHPTVGALPLVAPGLRFGRGGPWPTPPFAPPLLGEHTRSVLAGILHYSTERIDALIEAGTVAEPEAPARVEDHSTHRRKGEATRTTPSH